MTVFTQSLQDVHSEGVESREELVMLLHLEDDAAKGEKRKRREGRLLSGRRSPVS